MQIVKDFASEVEPRRRFMLALFGAPAPPDETPDNVVPIERADWLGGRDFGRFPVEWLAGLTLTQLRVALALAAHADKETGECWVSRARICALTGSDVADVKRALRVLERRQIIERLGLKRGVGHYRVHRGGDSTPGGTFTPEDGGNRTPLPRGATPAREPTPSNKSKEPTRCASRTSPATPTTDSSSSPGGTNEVPRARARTRNEPSPTDRTARAILSAAGGALVERGFFGGGLGHIIEAEDNWEQRNMAGARKLVERGRTPEQVVAMLKIAHMHPVANRSYGALIRLDELAEAWSRLAEFNAATGSQSENAHAPGHAPG